MYFSGLGTATPTTIYTKSECLAAFQDSDWYGRLDARSHLIARTVLQRDNGIETRHLALDSLADSFTIDPDTLAQRFLLNAPALATAAAERALASAALSAAQIDAVLISTCTGYLCPGIITSYVIERLGLREDVLALDLVGQGCGAALPNLGCGRRADCLRDAAGLRPVDLRGSVQRRVLPRRRPRRADQRMSFCRRRRGSGAHRRSAGATDHHSSR